MRGAFCYLSLRDNFVIFDAEEIRIFLLFLSALFKFVLLPFFIIFYISVLFIFSLKHTLREWCPINEAIWLIQDTRFCRPVSRWGRHATDHAHTTNSRIMGIKSVWLHCLDKPSSWISASRVNNQHTCPRVSRCYHWRRPSPRLSAGRR